MFALIICIAAGIQPVITSSSDQKLEKLRTLSPKVYGINRNSQDVANEVLRATGSKGVDIIINNTGPASILDDINMLRQRRGTISLVGFLDGFAADWNPSALLALLAKSAKLQSVSSILFTFDHSSTSTDGINFIGVSQ